MRDEMFYCAWCGIEMKWWKPYLGLSHCSDCSDFSYRGPGFYSEWEMHSFHSRVGMKEQ